MATETLYEVLGVRADASVEEIESAYKRRCVEFDPDGLPDHRTEIVRFASERMKLASRAWNVLSDPGKRREYDERARQGGPKGASGLDPEDEIERLRREVDAVRRDARAQGEGNEALLVELRRIRAFNRAQAELAVDEMNLRLRGTGATARVSNAVDDFLAEERRQEERAREQAIWAAKSPAQQERERAEFRRRRELERSEAKRRRESPLARFRKIRTFLVRVKDMAVFVGEAIGSVLAVLFLLAFLAGIWWVADAIVDWLGI